MTITRGAESVTAPVRWLFGSGSQAVTPVLERDGKFVEHRISWYREGNRLSLSPGHDPAGPLDVEDALGIVQTERNATRCFNCHQTRGSEPGVTCEACHSDASAHRAKPARGTIRRDRGVAVCAQCHRSPDTTFASQTPELEDPRSIRFAPVGFLASACYRKSTGFTCVTCHDPHGEPPRATVTEVCQSCHRTAAKAAAARTQCPRTPACTQCHMKASSPVANLRFTDHRIRVYRD